MITNVTTHSHQNFAAIASRANIPHVPTPNREAEKKHLKILIDTS